jgi:hypothetical protein
MGYGVDRTDAWIGVGSMGIRWQSGRNRVRIETDIALGILPVDPDWGEKAWCADLEMGLENGVAS